MSTDRQTPPVSHNPAIDGQALPAVQYEQAADDSLALGLHLADGRAIVQAQNVRWGLWQIVELALGVAELTFPFDVSGGAQRFKNHRCSLQHLHIRLALATLNTYLAELDWEAAGLSGLCDVQLQADGAAGLVLAGLYASGAARAPFTCRVAVRPEGLQTVRILFYDVRLFGLWPLPAPYLTMALCQALRVVPWEACAADTALLRPGAAFVGEVLPREGWRIPDLQRACLTAVSADGAGLEVALMACDPAAAQAALHCATLALPADAACAAAGMAAHAAAEAALAQGELENAYAAYRTAAGVGCTDSWVLRRLLSLGVAHPDWHDHTQALAHDVVRAAGPAVVEAHLALAGLALHRQDYAAAAAHYTTLGRSPAGVLSPTEQAATQMARAVAQQLQGPPGVTRSPPPPAPAGDMHRAATTLLSPVQPKDDTPAVCLAQFESLCDASPERDGPWIQRISLLMAHPELGSPTPVFETWAALRQGEPRAIVLEAWSAYLRGQGNVCAALGVLWAACHSHLGSSANVPRLMTLQVGYRGLGDWPQLMAVLQLQAEQQPAGAAQDAIWRQMADVASECLDDVLGAAAYLDRLYTPDMTDYLWQAGLLMDGGCGAQVADHEMLLGSLPENQRLVLAETLAAANDTLRLPRVLAPWRVTNRDAQSASAPTESVPQVDGGEGTSKEPQAAGAIPLEPPPPRESPAALEQASQAAPRDCELLQELMDRYTTAGDSAKKLLTAERLLALFSIEHFDADFFMGMAQDYLEIDPVRACHLAERALAKDPHNLQRQAFCRQVYAETGDWQRFASLEQDLVPNLQDKHERAQRAAALGAVYIEHLGDRSRGVVALHMACEAEPEQTAYMRQLAVIYAQDTSTYASAVQLYRQLLRHTPFCPATLRILARLTGQQGELDQCYGYYACLLCLAPEDAEATRFVMACRRVRPAVPAELITAQVQPIMQAKVPERVRGPLQEVGAAWLDLESDPAPAAATPRPHAIIQVISRDVQECLSTLMELRHLDSATQPAIVQVDAGGEVQDLFLYAQSQDYFELRAKLGVAFSAPTA